MRLAAAILFAWGLFTAPALADPIVANAAAIAGTGRVRLNFNADWRFTLGDVAGAEAPTFDDSAWQRVGLPHSFSIPYFQSSTFYTGPGWYRKAIDLPALPPGRRLSLEFEGAFQKAEIFVNGVAVGSHQGGYTGFPVDITSAARPGRNVVAVRVDNRWDPALAPRAGEHVFSGGLYRDVRLMKDAGFDFIRGSHYPHDPHFAEATDHIGMLFLSEAPFWGTGGIPSDWGGSAYPTDPKDRAAFDQSVKRQLAEMIRINRNHPSIIAWGMDNEVFFSAPETMPEVRRLLAEEVALTHKLDPTRPASVDGAQRGDIDHIGDIAGYNGDGAVLFPDPGLPNFVGEYGSTISDRPGVYEPGWGDIEHTPGTDPKRPYGWRLPWRSGEAIWAGFDHGSIAGRQFGSMGIVDYARLRKRSWYWYRNAYLGIAPPAWPQAGKPAALRLESSAPVLTHADGTDDVQLVVTVIDAQGRPLSNSPPVHLAIEDGPGELPTGRAIDFSPDGDIPIRDGQAAIVMRSWQSGITRIRVTSPGLRDAVLMLRTTDGPPFVPGVTPLAADRPYRPAAPVAAEGAEEVFGLDNPTAASSSAEGHPSRLANDGSSQTAWLAASGDHSPWITIDPERIVHYRRISLTFPQAAAYGVKAETKGLDGHWRLLVEQPIGADARRERELETASAIGGPVRLTITAPEGVPAGLAEARLIGVLQASSNARGPG